MPPVRGRSRFLESLRFVANPLSMNLQAREQFGDVWQLQLISRKDPFVVTSHPDHVKSVLTAKPADAPSLTGESPLRPILGPNSVLTSVGPRHMRQRKLLLPPFHGEAVQRYVEMIATVAEREIDRWPLDKPFALAPRMQAVTLDVIMGGVFGIGATPQRGTAEYRLRERIRRMLGASTNPSYQLIELRNAGRREARGVLKLVLVAGRPPGLRGDPRAPSRRRRERASRRPLAAAAGPRRGRPAAHRPRAARRADVAGAGRPRDHRQLAGLDVRAAAAHPAGLRPAA